MHFLSSQGRREETSSSSEEIEVDPNASRAERRRAERANRKRNAVPSVAIVGYTNAGKSSLLNRITSAGVLVENALFATLDPTVRKAETPDGRPFTIADTVGFVRNLPHQLVEAFQSTLEEVAEPFLVRAGLLLRTPRGRMATDAAWRHLAMTPPNPTLPL